MIKLTPFLLFDGQCSAAMTFYQACLGGELSITRLGDSPMKDQIPQEQHGKVVNAHLTDGAIDLTATDWLHPVRRPRTGNTVALYLNGTDLELKGIFDKLAVGADPDLLDPLRDTPFGAYGHLADAYGVHWFFQGERLG